MPIEIVIIAWLFQNRIESSSYRILWVEIVTRMNDHLFRTCIAFFCPKHVPCSPHSHQVILSYHLLKFVRVQWFQRVVLSICRNMIRKHRENCPQSLGLFVFWQSRRCKWFPTKAERENEVISCDFVHCNWSLIFDASKCYRGQDLFL
jgi:hypothetical protein